MSALRHHRRSLLASLVFVLVCGVAASGLMIAPPPAEAICSGFVPCVPPDKKVNWCHGDCCEVQYCTSSCDWGPVTYEGC